MLEEVRRVFSYEKIKKMLRKNRVTQADIDTYLETLSNLSVLVPGKLTLDIVKNDPANNKFLASAVEGDADFLISGDPCRLSVSAVDQV